MKRDNECVTKTAMKRNTESNIKSDIDTVISHKSALEYWRLHGNVKIVDVAGKRRNRLPAKIPNHGIIRDLVPSGLSYPVNLLVGSHNARRKSKIVAPRIFTGSTPKGCFISIGGGMVVSAPPLCFIQMAYELPLIKLIELGFELCGSYSLHASTKHGTSLADVNNSGPADIDRTLYGHKQLTNIKEIKEFTTHMKGMHGYKKALRAIRYIIDGSASPMETILVMLLTLPYKLGGYELPAPELNKRIDLGYAATLRPGSSFNKSVSSFVRSGRAYYVCDLFWPEVKLAVEYDSNFYHTGADRIISDSEKRLDLNTLGINVITVTSRQIRNIDEFENIAKLFARKLHKRLRYKTPQFTDAKRELRDLLFDHGRTSRDL